MTVKTTADGETVTTETMADRLRAVQSEHWRTMRYTDENEEAAWEIYNESLFLNPMEEEQDAEKPDPALLDERPLEDAVPRFGQRWDDDQLLEAVSGIKKPVPIPVIKAEPKPAAPKKVQIAEPEAQEVRQPKLRPRGGAVGALRRDGKARATASKTVDID